MGIKFAREPISWRNLQHDRTNGTRPRRSQRRRAAATCTFQKRRRSRRNCGQCRDRSDRSEDEGAAHSHVRPTRTFSGASDAAPKAPFQPAARRRMVCFQVSRVDHDRLWRGTRGSQTFHYAEEDTPFATSLPSVVEHLVNHIPRGIAPARPVAVDENDAAQINGSCP